jgi:hypothetical protein
VPPAKNLLLNFEQTNWQQLLPQSLRRHHACRPATTGSHLRRLLQHSLLQNEILEPEPGRQNLRSNAFALAGA